MRNAGTNDELQLLNDDEVVMNSLVTAGFVNKLLNKENKEIACDKVMIHYSLMVRKLEMDDIRRGMELVQLATVLKRAKELWAEIFPRVDDIQVTAEVLVNKLKLHSSENRSDESEKFLQWTKDYVASLPVSSDDKYAPTTGRFLLFVFASPQYPTRPLYIKFNRQEKSLPDPDACLGILSIPTNASSFDEFKRRMNVTISTQAQGYGRF